jgi:hypothetical protein
VLYSFPTPKQGYLPNGDLVFDRAGNLHGATTFGGGKGTTCDKFYRGQCGTVFELSPPRTKGGPSGNVFPQSKRLPLCFQYRALLEGEGYYYHLVNLSPETGKANHNECEGVSQRFRYDSSR